MKPLMRFFGFTDRVERRYCAAHRERCVKDGGGYLLTMGGMRRVWLCKQALAKRAKAA